MTILMEVSPNVDPDPIDTDEPKLNESKSRSKKSSTSKMNKKSELKKQKHKFDQQTVLDEGIEMKEESDMEVSMNGGDSQDESEMDTSILYNPDSGDHDDADGQDGWYMRTMGGRDLTSKPSVVSPSGKYVFINAGDKVLVYNSKTGLLLRQLITGEAYSIQKTDKDEEVIVAGQKKVVIWNFLDVKITKKFKIPFSKVPKYELGLKDIYIPDSFHQEKSWLRDFSESRGKP